MCSSLAYCPLIPGCGNRSLCMRFFDSCGRKILPGQAQRSALLVKRRRPPLLCDIAADDIARYQAKRLEERAAPKTVNLEVGTLRAILRKNRLWASIQPDVRMLRVREDVGRAISRDEEDGLLEACRASRSRSLYPAVLIALNTCMRYSELRLLRWEQVNLNSCTLIVGKSKTDSGTGRLLPLNDRAIAILRFW